MKVFFIFAAVCGTVLGAPQSTGSSNEKALQIAGLLTNIYDLLSERSEVLSCLPPFKILPESGECFYVSKEQLSWDKARDACKKMDGDLAIPRDTQALAKLLSTIPKDVSVSWFYVGGNDRASPGTKHSWINGRAVTGPWNDNQPKFSQDDNCLMVSHYTGNIADHRFGCVSSSSYSHMVGYICQRGCNDLAMGCMAYF